MPNFELKKIKSKTILISLIVCIFLQTALVFYFIQFNSSDRFHNENKKNEITSTSNIEKSGYSLVKNPQYYGLDNNNEPFTISAIDAIQISNNRVLLNHVIGTAKLNPTTTLTFYSESSEMELDSYTINAHKAKIKVNGITLTTDNAIINTKSHSLEGKQNVNVKENIAEITADYCIITENYNEVFFRSINHVTTYITP